jgi:hypothetical protein
MNETNFEKWMSYEYLTVPMAYLHTCKVLIKDIKWNIRNWVSNYNEDRKSLLNPLLYNFFHGIELYCKYYLIFINWKFENKHDIKWLLSDLEVNISEKSLKEKTSILREQISINKQNTDYKYVNYDYNKIMKKSWNNKFNIIWLDITFDWTRNIDVIEAIEEYICTVDKLFEKEIYDYLRKTIESKSL